MSGVVSSSSIAVLIAATRTMKNSSRFDPAIAANFTRSRSGVRGSAASSSTRSLNANQESSRLMNSDVSICSVGMGSQDTAGLFGARDNSHEPNSQLPDTAVQESGEKA